MSEEPKNLTEELDAAWLIRYYDLPAEIRNAIRPAIGALIAAVEAPDAAPNAKAQR